MPLDYDSFHVHASELELVNCFCCSDISLGCLCSIQTLSVLPNKAKFIYPKIDPQPSDILDNRTNPEKMQSILRTLNQF